MSFRKSFFKNILTYGGFTYSSTIIQFLSFTVLSRLLLPSEYGFVALITVFTGFISIFSDAGLSFAVIRSDYKTTLHKSLNNLTLLFGGALAVLVTLLAYPIAWFYEDSSLVWPTLVFSLMFVFKSLSIVPQAILNKALKFNLIGQSQLISNILIAAISILMAWLGFSYWALILPQLFGALCLYLLLNRYARLPLKLYPWRYTRAGFEKAKWLIKNILGFNLINYWARNADNLIIGKFYSKADLGIYSKSYSLLTLPLTLISSIFGTILFPSLKDLHNKGGDTKTEYANVLGLISLINYPVSVVLILFAEPLVRILWGEKWLVAAEFVPYFGLLVLTQTLTSTVGSYYILIKKERTMLWLGAANAVLLVVSIAIGAFFSVLYIARIYALGCLTTVIPLLIYVGFYRSFGYSAGFLLKFWAPKLVCSLLLLASVWKGNHLASAIILFLLLVHLLFQQRNNLGKAATLVQQFTQRKQ